MPKNNDLTGLLDRDDMKIAQGDVYLDPQTLEDLQHDTITSRDPADKKEEKAKGTKPAAYKAKLLLTGEQSPIGQFQSSGTRVSTRIYFDTHPHWSSSIRIEIKAWVRKASEHAGGLDEEKLIHKWVIRLNVACDVSTQPEMSMYPKAFIGKKGDEFDYLEDAYVDYCIKVPDDTAVKLRVAGQLGYVSFSFRPDLAHTEGILHDRPIPSGFQKVQDQLFRIFTKSGDTIMGLSALFALSEEKSFHVALGGVWDAFALERVHPPYTRWFGGIADAKSKVQKGQVTPRAERPPVVLPFSFTYANSNDCWTAEGMSIIYQEENEIQDAKDAQIRECQLRVMKATPGGDRMYIALLRLPSGFEHRFSAGDSFLVDFGEDKKWSATILPEIFPFTSSIDYTIALNRPLLDDKEYSNLVIESVFDLPSAIDASSGDVEAFCFNGNFTKVKVIPILLDKAYKFRLAAIKTLNPAHQEDKHHVHNPRWQTLIIGQDLRTNTKCNLFEGIDIPAKLRQWSIKLDPSQLEALEYFTEMPNHMGIVKGPWGTGKTKVDMVITMLLMSAGKKVKVLSPTNKAADSFVLRLNAEITRLKDKGITITDKHVVRFHSPTTEQAVVKVDSQRHKTRDTTYDRWQPSSTLLACQYDRIAAQLVDRARERPWGVFDSRYKLHDASFGTLLLQVAGLLNRPPPAFVETPQDNAPNTTEAGDTAPNTTEAGDTAPNTTEAEDNAPNTTEAGDTAPQGDTATVPIIEDSNTAWSAGKGGSDEDVEEDDASADDEYDDYSGFDQGDDYHHPVGATYTGPTTKVAQEHQQMIQSRTQQKLDEARGLTQREKLCACFREMFLEAEKNNLDSKEQWETFKSLERLLSQDILSNDIAVLSTTLVNSGHSIVKNHFKGDHVIVQEASKAENGDVFIALANCETSIHLSGDNAQLPPQKQDVARNPFAQQTNMSMYHRWVSLGYSISELKEQHRTIPGISDIISDIWYRNTVVSTVDPTRRPNARMAIATHQTVFNRSSSIMWIHTDGESNKLGFSQSSQNEQELKVAIKLCKAYIEHGIAPTDIVILAGYIAQVGLTKRALARTSELRDVDASTIDAYQGEEKPVVILCIVGSQKLGFMSEGARLLSGMSRAGDALAIITNETGIQTSEHARKRFQYDKVRTLIGPLGQVVCGDPLPELNMVMHDHDLLLDDGVEGEVNLIPEDDAMDQATSEGGNGEEFTSSWDDGENQQDEEAGNDTPLNTPTW